MSNSVTHHSLVIRPLEEIDLTAVKEFTDRAIGKGYYSAEEIQRIFEQSKYVDESMLTLVLAEGRKIYGVRITYPPGKWTHGKGQGLTVKKWPHPLNQTAYFQSLFIDPEMTAQGWGKKLSLKAIEALRKVGTQGIVCHSWKESPHDSSGRYLRGLGFTLVATHPEYWKEVDYECTRCGKPCHCTAEEMYLDLEPISKKGTA